ncbi:MAG: zinc-binding dehydrogenase [Myxococcota bacterium]
MRCAHWTEDGLELVDEKPPPLTPGWVRLRVLANGICGTDVHLFRRELPPLVGNVPGHELVGRPTDGPTQLPESLYAVEPIHWCGGCDDCLAGNRHRCPQLRIFGIQLRGGLAETIDVPRACLHAVDPRVSVLVASLAEPFAVAVRGLHLARLETDSRVLVLGAGTIGLMSALLARDRAAAVAISARHPQQRKLAESLGVTALEESQIDAWAGENAPDVVIETVGGHAETLAEATRSCRAGGRIIVIGVFSRPMPVNVIELLVKELSLVGSNTYGTTLRGPEFRSAVELLPRYHSELQPLLTHQFPLSSVHEAFRCASQKASGAIKVTVLPGQAGGSEHS